MKTTVIGAGAWGTALARLLALGGGETVVWSHSKARLEELRVARENRTKLPGILLPAELRYEPDLDRAVRGADCLVLAVPSKFFREVSSAIPWFNGIAVSVTKGIEYETGLTMCGILSATMPKAAAVALSGPTLAMEVARDNPSAIVAASCDAAAAETVQRLFHRPTFRVYTSQDSLGVELGGALKNVIAIAAGVCDGLGLGDNSKAALITRGIVEMRRLGVACGAQPETFSGLSGLGDLTVTCFSRLSRNRGFGEQLGRGEPLAAIADKMTSVAEGWPTSRSACHLARSKSVDTPIIEQVYAMLYEGKNLVKALEDLTARESKPE